MTFSSPTSGHRALRKGRYSEPGRIYLITTTTHRRVRHFDEWEIASRVCSVMDNANAWQPHARLLCWVLMPDHWHGLVELATGTTLSKVVGMVKGRSARAATMDRCMPSPLWAAGFHDRALRREDDVVAAARYITANPLRAGLVTSVRQYPYWNCVWI